MAELKKCPFCGSKAKVLEHYNEGTVEICCADEFGICYIAPHTEEGFYLHEVERDWNNRPTEAEIRASAITAMSKAMKEYYPSCKGAYVDFDVFFHAVMANVAEQFKEE